MQTVIDEWRHITQGKFIVVMLIVPLVIAACFGYIYKNSTVNEAPLAVIDLDHSTYSRQLINKLDSSQYVQVAGVYDNYIEADLLLYNEKYSGVLYLPAGLEAAYLQGKTINTGLYLDMTLSSSAGSIRTGVSEVIAAENAVKGTPLPIALEQRTLYNPTNSTIMGPVILFINVVMVALFALYTLSIVPRLRQEGRLQEELQQPLGIIWRVLPYALIACVSTYLVMGVLKQFGSLRFEANWLQIFVPFFLYTISSGLLAMLIGWTAPNTILAKARIVVLMLPSFLLSGGQVPVVLLPEILQWINKVIPLTIHLKFLRGMAYKGGDLRYFIPDIGHYLILIGVFLLGIFFLILKEKKIQMKSVSEGTS
ncbi:Inner membrane transport permease YhhJ [Sporotomaculum syntrophicum]|uniref:Inner membrane transport permease YhhJ n=1 Tax=Sporotomaculum syntrophicum TaxID=182264 RepID=A0A9D2WNJ1_9FIRM|nr:ABC transporter permease [Sporotomaculum syntrophicum]KAF1084036.1 Inner membrane transport permease YhhJ [Sporotomaculum syntrophicum]